MEQDDVGLGDLSSDGTAVISFCPVLRRESVTVIHVWSSVQKCPWTATESSKVAMTRRAS